MSTRSSTSSEKEKDHVAKAFMRSFIELIENFVAEDKHLDAVYTCITALFEVLSVDDRSNVLKKILMHFLRKFPIEFGEDGETTPADEYIRKTLYLWRLFGKCSKTMGPVSILEKIEDTYAGCWQYYLIYAEALIEEGRTDTDELYKTFNNCMEHCDLTNEKVREIFGPKVMSYVKFPEVAEEDECTIQFMQIRQNDIRKSLAARRRSSVAPNRLHAILESHDENLPKSGISHSSQFRKPMSVLKNTELESVTLKAQPNQTVDQTCATIHKTNADDFTVFKDPTIALGQRKSFDPNPSSPTVCGTHLLPKKPVFINDPIMTSTPDYGRKMQPPSGNEKGPWPPLDFRQ